MNVLPPRWMCCVAQGLCALVRMKVSVTMLHSGVNDIIKLEEVNGDNRTKTCCKFLLALCFELFLRL